MKITLKSTDFAAFEEIIDKELKEHWHEKSVSNKHMGECLKGIVSRKFAMLLLVPLESQNYSKPFLLKAFLKISSFSCRIFDVKIFGFNSSPKWVT
jgi:hypothetical protein